MSDSGIHPRSASCRGYGGQERDWLEAYDTRFTKEKSCCLMRRPRGIASLLAGAVLMSLKAFLQVIDVAKWQLSVGNNVGVHMLIACGTP